MTRLFFGTFYSAPKCFITAAVDKPQISSRNLNTLRYSAKNIRGALSITVGLNQFLTSKIRTSIETILKGI